MADVIHMRNEQLEEDRLPDDDGGHLIARAFGGSKDIDNLVPQSKYINRSLKRTENGITWRKNGEKQLTKAKCEKH